MLWAKSLWSQVWKGLVTVSVGTELFLDILPISAILNIRNPLFYKLVFVILTMPAPMGSCSSPPCSSGLSPWAVFHISSHMSSNPTTRQQLWLSSAWLHEPNILWFSLIANYNLFCAMWYSVNNTGKHLVNIKVLNHGKSLGLRLPLACSRTQKFADQSESADYQVSCIRLSIPEGSISRNLWTNFMSGEGKRWSIISLPYILGWCFMLNYVLCLWIMLKCELFKVRSWAPIFFFFF